MMKRLLALLTILLIVALLVVFLQAGVYAYAAPKEDSSGDFSPDYVIQKMREEAGVSPGNSVSWSSFGKRLVDGAMNTIRWFRRVAVLPLLVVILIAGLMLIFGFIWSFTKLVRWAASIIAAAVAGWLLIQIAPLIVVWLSSLFSG
jgi:hypothetical protein